MRFHNKLLVTLAVTTGLHSAPATPSPPQSPKFTVIKHDLTQDWEFITLYNACIRCTLEKDNTFPCEVINTSIVRNLTDEWGPWPRLETVSIKRDTSWISHSNFQIEHTERLLVPFLEHKYALHNVYHQMIGTVWPVLNSLTHFRPTSVLFRQPLTSPGQPLPNSIFKELVTLTLGAGYVTLKQPVCASELVLQTHLIESEIQSATVVRDKPIDTLWKHLDSRPRIALIHRRKSRHIENRAELFLALKKLTPYVFELSFEDHTLLEQLQLVHKVTTLIGAHGAGMIYGRFIRQGGAIIELSPFPCVHYASPHGAPGFHSTFRSLDRGYELLPSTNRSLSAHCKNKDADPRSFDVTANVSVVINAVKRLDPILSNQV